MSNVRGWLSGGHVHFCNLQLGLMKLQEDTPQADIENDRSRRCLSCGKVQLPLSWSRSLISPCSRTTLLGDNTRFSVTWHDRRRRRRERSRDASGRRFPSHSASRGRRFCSSWNRLLIYAQCWSCFSELDVGWSEPLLFLFKRQSELRKSQAGADVTLSDVRVTGSWNIVTLSAQWPTSSKGT